MLSMFNEFNSENYFKVAQYDLSKVVKSGQSIWLALCIFSHYSYIMMPGKAGSADIGDKMYLKYEMHFNKW